MSDRQPPIHWHNLFILGQYQYQAMAVFLFPLIALVIAASAAGWGWEACGVEDCTAMQRLGDLWSAVGFVYVLLEEVLKVMPQSMHEEIEGSFALFEDDLPDARQAKERFRKFARFTGRIRMPLVRTMEAFLVVVGTLLGGFGDLLGAAIRTTLLS